MNYNYFFVRLLIEGLLSLSCLLPEKEEDKNDSFLLKITNFIIYVNFKAIIHLTKANEK